MFKPFLFMKQIIYCCIIGLLISLFISESLINIFKTSFFEILIIFIIINKGQGISDCTRNKFILIAFLYSIFIFISIFLSVNFSRSITYFMMILENFTVIFGFYLYTKTGIIDIKKRLTLIYIIAAFSTFHFLYIIFTHFTLINIVSLNGWIKIFPSDYFGRQTGFFEFPAYISGLFCIAFPLIVYLWKNTKWNNNVFKHIFFTILVLINILGIYFVRSTGAFLAIMIGVIFYFFVILFKKYNKILISALLIFFIFFSIIILTNIYHKFPEKTKIGFKYRYTMLKGALDLGLFRPLFGSGPDTFHHEFKVRVQKEPNRYPYYSDRWYHAHNSIMNTVAESGLIAGILLFSFIILIIYSTVHRYYETKDDFSLFLSLSVVCIFIYSLSDVVLTMKPSGTLFWALCGIFLGLSFRTSTHKETVG